ncbi:MAG: CHRD domain-containing protein [Acidobacteriota bacterium]
MASLWKKAALAAGVVLGLAAPAAAQQFTLVATLTGTGESTQTTNGVNTGAFGDATVVVDMAARTVTYTVRVFNLPSGVSASHIHAGSIQTAGPVVVNFAPPVPASNDFAFGGVVKDTEFVLRPEAGIRGPDDMFQAIIGGNSYVNVHSQANPGGEIRGQLTLKP